MGGSRKWEEQGGMEDILIEENERYIQFAHISVLGGLPWPFTKQANQKSLVKEKKITGDGEGS